MTDPEYETHTVAVDASHTYKIDFDYADLSFKLDREVALLWLVGVQNHLNQVLQMKGILFLNEVLDALHLPRTYAGQLVGWTHQGQYIHLDPKLEGEGSTIELLIKVEGYILDDLR